MKIKKYFGFVAIIIFFTLTFLFYWKTFIKGLSPFPGDMLTGAYYPWLNQKWGYAVGVPVKNPLISDVYSINYIEKSLIAESFKNFKIPLWNPYSYSGIPILADFHSGVFNPFNYLMVWFGNIQGWNYLIICQTIGSLFTMYLFLRTLKRDLLSSIIGSVVYAFSGFSIVWLLYGTTGYSLLWLPLLFLFIEKYFQTKNTKYLIPFPLLLFLLMAAGHIQLFCFGSFISGSYFLWRLFNLHKKNVVKPLILFLSVCITGIGLMAIQILPTLDLIKNSIRYSENFIESQNYGLLPIGKLITLFAPDFFGNPTTFNYWGFFDYNETILYASVLGLMALIFCIFNFKKITNEKFFVIFSILSLLLVTNNPVGKLIYIMKVPAISTSAAGRTTIIFTFCIAVLTSYFINNLKLIKIKDFIRYYWGLFAFVAISILMIFIIKHVLKTQSDFNQTLFTNLNIAFRNMFVPCLILFSISLSIVLFKNKNISKVLILIILVADLFRFGWKYIPFVNKNLVYPSTPIIDYLKQQPGIFRVEKERGALLPPNTWAAYRLQSTSGYEPLAFDRYTTFYNQTLNFAPVGSNSSRYSELDYFDAQKLGEANVRYLIAFKYDKQYKITSDGTFLNPKINIKDWKKVDEENNIVLLENQKFQPRFRFSDNSDSKSSINVISYQPNQILISYSSSVPNNIILTNTWDTGWKAQLNSKNIPVNIYNQTFQSIPVPAGNNNINIYYSPDSFQKGKTITCLFVGIYFILGFTLFINKKR